MSFVLKECWIRFDERVLIFTTSIETFIFLKWQITKMIVGTINHKNSHANMWIESKEIDTVSIKRYVRENPEENVIKVANKW